MPSILLKRLLENMLFHFQSNFTGVPLEFLQYNYFEELPFLKTYRYQPLFKGKFVFKLNYDPRSFRDRIYCECACVPDRRGIFSFSFQERRKTSRSTVSNPGVIAGRRTLLLRVGASMAWLPCATQHLSGLGLHAHLRCAWKPRYNRSITQLSNQNAVFDLVST